MLSLENVKIFNGPNVRQQPEEKSRVSLMTGSNSYKPQYKETKSMVKKKKKAVLPYQESRDSEAKRTILKK